MAPRGAAVGLVAVAALGAALLAGGASAQAERDQNLEHPTSVVTVPLQGHSISALVVRQDGAGPFRHGVALFAGHPGILKVREENGAPVFEMKGNFLVRSRRHWLDAETLVAVVDAPSDEWASFRQAFRETARYGADVGALLSEIGKRYGGVTEWTFVGTSEGSVSAYHAARMNPQLAKRVILTASVFQASGAGPGLSAVKWRDLPWALLVVHHEYDPCQYTAYRDAQRVARESAAPLITVRGGGPSRGEACQAFTAHGFVGLEREVVLGMRAWVKTGQAPAEIAK